jgi:hypothetical protein
MQPSAFAVLAHPFGNILKDWEQGVPVDCGPDWMIEVILKAVAQGPHLTAMTLATIALFHQNIAYQAESGFAEIVLWEELQQDPPKALKILPAVAMPQTKRCDCIILDLSFPVH